MAPPTTALLVRFKSSLPLDDVTRVMEERVGEFRALQGLRQKYYLKDPATGEVAGFYLWDSPEALEEFSRSELRATIAEAYQAESPPRIEVYEVMMALREA